MSLPADLPSPFRLDGRLAVVIGDMGALGGHIASPLAEAGEAARSIFQPGG